MADTPGDPRPPRPGQRLDSAHRIPRRPRVGANRDHAATPIAPIGDEAELAIYRIAQEALTNAVRHSGATTIIVRMQSNETELVLQIADDGDALPEGGADGPGLRGMRERALMIGGLLNIGANPGRGLRVALTVPIGHLGG